MFHEFSMRRCYVCVTVLIAILLFSSLSAVHGAIITRVKDISNIQGMRDNYLFGYGLIVGLQGTGDSTTFAFTSQ